MRFVFTPVAIHARLYYYLICTLSFVFAATALSCSSEEERCAVQPDVSGINIGFSFSSLEDSLANVRSKNELVSLLTRHDVLRDYVLRRKEYPNDSVFIDEIFSRFSNPHVDTLLSKTKEVFGDYGELRAQFKEAFTNFKFYYPEFKAPKVMTVVTGLLGNDLFVSDSLIIVSVDFFLGPGAKYRPRTYDYILRQYQKQNIVPSCMLIYGISEKHNATNPADKTVLADMIAYGKAYYFAKRMLPCTPDSVFIWYTPKEIRQSRKNQDLIWARLIQDQVLYATSHMTKQKYLAERPKTIEVGPECPGRIAQFVGWEIINAYMKSHPDETMPELMARDNARQILESSGYTKQIPKR